MAFLPEEIRFDVTEYGGKDVHRVKTFNFEVCDQFCPVVRLLQLQVQLGTGLNPGLQTDAVLGGGSISQTIKK